MAILALPAEALIMSAMDLRYPSPPPVSPWAQSAFGVALALNVLLAAGVHLGLSFATSSGVTDDLTIDVMRAAPVVYLALLLPIVALYGLAAAAWTGWSWWRVPWATLAGATLALGINAQAMAHWIARKGWPVNEMLSVQDPRLDYLLGLAGISMLILVLIGASLWPRWFRDDPPAG